MKAFNNIKKYIGIVLQYGGLAMALYAAIKTFHDKVDEYDPNTDTKITE